MTCHHPLLPLLLLFFFSFSFTTVTLAQVPANQTFIFVNEGEFGDRGSEYGASYRVIRNDVYTFFSRPFRLCFYNTTPDAAIFAIRAGLPDDSLRWVWDANRNHPVRENATLSFSTDGNLVLAEATGEIVWQTNTANKGVTGIRLLSNGNLVLFNKKGKFIWQSFDYPTDTLLRGMSLKINGTNKLISRKSDEDGSDGPYSFVLDPKKIGVQFQMRLNNSGNINTPIVYAILGNDILGPVVTFDAFPSSENGPNGHAYELVMTFPFPPPRSLRRRLLQSAPPSLHLSQINYNATFSYLRLGSDGSLKAYTYYDDVNYLKWSESYNFFSSPLETQCELPSKCSRYGLCDREMCVACPTPMGLLGWTDDCAPPKLPPCGGGGAKVSYYKIVGVEHFLNKYMDDGVGPVKVGECRERCSQDCNCLGFIYKEYSFKCLLVPYLGTLIKNVNATSVGYIKYSI